MSIVFVNPYSAGGKGAEKWERVKLFLDNGHHTVMLNKDNKVNGMIKDFRLKGYTDFIAAGGDGTINLILNNMINSLTTEELKEIKLGAIGIGSSNDFHKPVNGNTISNGIPAKIDFGKAELRDVGCLTYLEENIEKKKYFLINASIGITADANHLFNNSDKTLSLLKRRTTGLSILYSALKTITSYRNMRVKILSGEEEETEFNLTNLGIIKNPSFSGNLKYDSEINYHSGLFDIHLCNDMSKREIIKLMYMLSRGSFYKVKKKRSWKTKKLTVISKDPFFVEFDGEIIKTGSAAFSVLPELIKVCVC